MLPIAGQKWTTLSSCILPSKNYCGFSSQSTGVFATGGVTGPYLSCSQIRETIFWFTRRVCKAKGLRSPAAQQVRIRYRDTGLTNTHSHWQTTKAHSCTNSSCQAFSQSSNTNCKMTLSEKVLLRTAFAAATTATKLQLSDCFWTVNHLITFWLHSPNII